MLGPRKEAAPAAWEDVNGAVWPYRTACWRGAKLMSAKGSSVKAWALALLASALLDMFARMA